MKKRLTATQMLSLLLLAFLGVQAANASEFWGLRASQFDQPQILSRKADFNEWLPGGVAFVTTAPPSPYGAVSALEYVPSAADGDRFRLVMGGETVVLKGYDWELVPLARVVATDYDSLIDMHMTRSGLEFAYHPAIVNTLMGLRLAHADFLILSPGAAKLPADDDGNPILGEGESMVGVHENVVGLNIRLAGMAYQREGSDSYTITDQGSAAPMPIQNGTLNATGTPAYWYLWSEDRNGTPGNGVPIHDAQGTGRLRATIAKLGGVHPVVHRAVQRAAVFSSALRRAKEDMGGRKFDAAVKAFRHVQVPTVRTPGKLSVN